MGEDEWSWRDIYTNKGESEEKKKELKWKRVVGLSFYFGQSSIFRSFINGGISDQVASGQSGAEDLARRGPSAICHHLHCTLLHAKTTKEHGPEISQ